MEAERGRLTLSKSSFGICMLICELALLIVDTSATSTADPSLYRLSKSRTIAARPRVDCLSARARPAKQRSVSAKTPLDGMIKLLGGDVPDYRQFIDYPNVDEEVDMAFNCWSFPVSEYKSMRFAMVSWNVAGFERSSTTSLVSRRSEECGWWRIAQDVNDVIMCSDGVARIIYQGTLRPGKYF
jgi:hypothetical protein